MGENVSFDAAIARFEQLYMAGRNLSDHTRAAYRRDVRQLAAFLEDLPPGEVKLSDLQAYMAHLDELGRAGSTRRRKAAALRTFFAFLAGSDLIAHNPAAQLAPPAADEVEPRFLSESEYRALLRTCAHQTRDAALIELMLQTGIRVSEAARLAVNDIELPARINDDPANMGSIRIRSKGGKVRTLPLNAKACRALNAYLQVRPDIEEQGLFVTKFGKPMKARAIQRAVAKHMRAAKIEGATVHTLRHTFATHHVARGTSLRTVQEALGHADLKTTSIYVSMAKAAMKRDLQENAL
jgi:integrase/recombinase XerD